MKILIICNTSYQVIAAVQMRRSVFPDEEVSLILTDHSAGLEAVGSRLEKYSLFKNIWYCRTKELCYGRGLFRKAAGVLKGIFGSDLGLPHDAGGFDRLLYCNEDAAVLALYAHLSRSAPGLQGDRFEEGVSSYDHRSFPFGKIYPPIFFARRLLGKPNLPARTERFFCFYPELYEGELIAAAMDRMGAEDSETKALLRDIFMEGRAAEVCPEHFIYLSGIFDREGGAPIGERALVERLAELTGRDKLAVKTHPREPGSIYEEMGLRVMPQSSVPWEILQLSGDFSGKTLLSAVSGGVLNFCALAGAPRKIVFLYPLCELDGNRVATEAAAALERVLARFAEGGPGPSVTVVRSMQELEALIGEEIQT